MVRWTSSLLVIFALAGCHRGSSSSVPTGCAQPIAPAELWRVLSDQEMHVRYEQARTCARARGVRILLEFTADWCPDCREMTTLEQRPEVASVLQARYERVRVHVGHWDRHESLRRTHGIDRIAAYVVVDPNSNQRVARTTVEPVSNHQPMTPERWISWLENPVNTQ